MNILVIAAHPDDEILGMGGTMKKYTKLGHRIKVIIMATGIMARRSTNYKNNSNYDVDESDMKEIKRQLKELRDDAKKANRLVGVRDIVFYEFPDNEMDLVSNLKVTKIIEKEICNFKPSLVFTHSSQDINMDHRILYNATMTATRPVPDCRVSKVLSFEIPSSTEWNFPNEFSPNVFVDISKELKFKLKAMAAYKKELKYFPHPRSLKGLESAAQRWGMVAGFKAAEPFFLVRELQKDIP